MRPFPRPGLKAEMSNDVARPGANAPVRLLGRTRMRDRTEMRLAC
jgi:hypothetical protein